MSIRTGSVSELKLVSNGRLLRKLHILREVRELNTKLTPVIARSPCDEAIHSFFARRDGLLRGACHRAALCADPLARNDGGMTCPP